MKIASVKIENFRGIHSLYVDCGERMNVIIGNNGAGKSTVLVAIRILLSWFVARIRSRDGKGLRISDDDITSGESFCRLEILLDNGTRWKLFKQKSKYRGKAIDKTDLTQLTAMTDRLMVEREKSAKSTALPAIGYYGVNRAVADVTPEVSKKSQIEAEDSYDVRLNNGANFTRFFDWFRELEDIENANYRNTGRLDEDGQLNAVRRALESVLPGMGHFHVSRKPRAFMLEKDGVSLRIDQLSDGEKCYLTLIGDIARMLSMVTNGILNPLQGCGMILIDEVDLHLHPQWQTEVISLLGGIFPNCQFFLTTHSPFVVSSLKSFENDRFLLMDQGEGELVSENTFGKSVSEILTEFFEMKSLRNQEVHQRLTVIWQCLAKGDSSSKEFCQASEWLKKNLSPSDIAFAHINLERKKLEGKKI